MRSGEYVVPVAVDVLALLLRIPAPEQEHDPLATLLADLGGRWPTCARDLTDEDDLTPEQIAAIEDSALYEAVGKKSAPKRDEEESG